MPYGIPFAGAEITSFMGPRGRPLPHPGGDLQIPGQTDYHLYPVAAGTIVGSFTMTDDRGLQSLCLLVAHNDGRSSLYMGLSRNDILPVGTPVDTYMVIGRTGNTDGGSY